VSGPVDARTGGRFKYIEAAGIVRAQIANGILRPGASAPSGAELSRTTGYSPLTCRRGLRALLREGALVSGPSPNARLRVPARAATPDQRNVDSALRALSAALAARRRAAGLTQPQLAKILGASITTVGHAETGRLWQSRRFWELADTGLGADGEILALHDAYRAASAAARAFVVEDAVSDGADDRAEMEMTADDQRTIAVAASRSTTSVTVTWADGAVTTVYPPKTPAWSAGATPVH
jgi:DNA-binding transcriptional regulator YhcF (GntR family)